jgi:hypothetical protein
VAPKFSGVSGRRFTQISVRAPSLPQFDGKISSTIVAGQQSTLKTQMVNDFNLRTSALICDLSYFSVISVSLW